MASQRSVRRSASIVFFMLGMLTVGVIFLAKESLLAQDQKPLDKPPAGQTYVGEKKCASCHFDQDLNWKKTKHAKSFDDMPAKYHKDASCLKCHATGFGEPTGFTNAEDTPGLKGTSCEVCHGPGSKHSEVAQTFTGKQLSDAQKKYVGSYIYLNPPEVVCLKCHQTIFHKKHPAYEKAAAQ
jgi:hypothetical protein